MGVAINRVAVGWQKKVSTKLHSKISFAWFILSCLEVKKKTLQVKSWNNVDTIKLGGLALGILKSRFFQFSRSRTQAPDLKNFQTPRLLFSQTPMLPESFAPRLPRSQTPMLSDSYASYAPRLPRSQTPMLPDSYASRLLCSQTPLLPGSCAPRLLCSQTPMFPDSQDPRIQGSQASRLPEINNLKL